MKEYVFKSLVRDARVTTTRARGTLKQEIHKENIQFVNHFQSLRACKACTTGNICGKSNIENIKILGTDNK